MSANSDSINDPRLSGRAIDQAATDRPRLVLRDAARRLGIASADLRNLMAAGLIAGHWGRDENGATTAYVYADAVDALAERIGAMTPMRDESDRGPR